MVTPLNREQSRKKKVEIKYSNIITAIRPVPHSDKLPVLIPPNEFETAVEDENNLEEI